MSPALIQKVFEKTGIWPFNPSVISAEMVAPSKETSQKDHLPFTPSSPVHTAANRLEHALRLPTETVALLTDVTTQGGVGNATAIVDSVMDQLQDPAIDYMAQNSLIKPPAQLPPLPTTSLSPIKQRLPQLPENKPKTPLERELIKKLQDATIKKGGIPEREDHMSTRHCNLTRHLPA